MTHCPPPLSPPLPLSRLDAVEDEIESIDKQIRVIEEGFIQSLIDLQAKALGILVSTTLPF